MIRIAGEPADRRLEQIEQDATGQATVTAWERHLQLDPGAADWLEHELRDRRRRQEVREIEAQMRADGIEL